MTVYTPGEDTYLVLDHLEQEDLRNRKILEMGTGNGLIALKAAEKGAEVTAADTNPEALKRVREKAEQRGLEEKVETVQTDLFSSIDQTYNLIIFNPPYLPGEEGIGDEEIWLGGETGVEVAGAFLDEAPDYLRGDGSALVVMSSLSALEELKEVYSLETVSERDIWFERLELLRFE